MTPISNGAVIEGVQRLLHEFLDTYFDGDAHTCANTSGTWPACALSFDLARPPQPLAGPCITTVLDLRSHTRYQGEPTDVAWDDLGLSFYVKAKVDAATPGSGASLAREVAQRLAALLNDASATRPLAQNGLMHLSADAQQVVPETEWALRIVRGSAVAYYTVEHV